MGMAMEIDVACIIVLYQTDDSFFNNLDLVRRQVQKVYIIDNGCPKEFTIKLQKIIKNSNDNLSYKKAETNVGLAKAQNIGIKKAISDGYKSILFLDDDSTPDQEMITRLATHLRENKNVGIVAPDIVHSSGGKQKYWVKEKSGFWRRRGFKEGESFLGEVNTVIASGSLISVKVIKKIGLMREDYFIDYIDIEYCLRVRSFQFKIHVLKNAKLLHQLGERTTYKPLGFEISPTNHSSLRKYYMTRNRILTWKLYAKKIPSWFLIDLLNFFFDTTRTLFLEKQKYQKLKSICKGFKEGLQLESPPIIYP